VQVRCIRDFGGLVAGDVAEVPDGSQVDPAHWEPVAEATALPPQAVEAAKGLLDGLAERVTAPAKEGMLWHRHPG
jgi:hypothetical protein